MCGSWKFNYSLVEDHTPKSIWAGQSGLIGIVFIKKDTMLGEYGKGWIWEELGERSECDLKIKTKRIIVPNPQITMKKNINGVYTSKIICVFYLWIVRG